MDQDPTTVPAICGAVRLALSARLDGEDAGIPARLVDEHLGDCRACGEHGTALTRIHRSSRLTSAQTVPDLGASILAAVERDRAADRVGHRSRRRAPVRPARAGAEGTTAGNGRRTRDLRLLVAAAGIVQLVLASAVLLGAVGPDLHSGRDLGALQLAVGVGLLVAALQPWRAAGVLPIVSVVVAVTVLVAIRDVAAGGVSPVAELSHLGEVIGLAALWRLRRRQRPSDGAAAPPHAAVGIA